MDPHLSAEAVALLESWCPPTASQQSSTQAYLAYLEARPDAWSRECQPGHLTASAMIFAADLSQVALVLHGILGIWVQPGGHLEPSDADLLTAARREVREELGIEVDLDPDPVTLDCHRVTCRGYPRPTRHFDIRFVGRAAPGATLACSDESDQVAWWPLSALPEGLHPDIVELIGAGSARLTEDA
ncbi:MAG: NUDIX hydrolase [Propioniciclava sp.]